MDKKQAKENIDKLRKDLEYYADKYYNEDSPEISDYEYDMMLKKLKELENQFPEFITRDSLIKFDTTNAHRALFDCHMTYKLFLDIKSKI